MVLTASARVSIVSSIHVRRVSLHRWSTPGSTAAIQSVISKKGENGKKGKPTKANLVHDGDAGLLGGLVQLHHGGRDVARGDDVLLGPDGGLDDGRVPGVGDQADDEVVLGDLGVEGRVVAGIERDGGGALDAIGELLGRLERAAGFRFVSG